ncbi:phage baseplate assembly protein V [Hydrogenimonas sp.]
MNDLIEAMSPRQGGGSAFATAVVTDNSDPDGTGRVKIRYPWSGEGEESYWARVVTFMAGSGFGGYFLPEVGDEVLVAFVDGDVESPVVIGALWNDADTPPYDNGDGKNNLRAIKTRQGHEILFDDDESAPKVTIKTAAGHAIELDDTPGSEKVTIKDKSGNMVQMDAAANSMTLKSAVQLTIESNMVDIKADGVLTLKGSLVRIN